MFYHMLYSHRLSKEFLEYREAQQTKVDQSIADKENGAYPV